MSRGTEALDRSGRPKFSVVIPCFNAERTLAETIDSALAQGPDVEVVVVDDGSTDGSAKIMAAYGERVTAIFGPNRGVSAARNQGFSQTTGEWIVFLDSDDLLCPGTLMERLTAAQDSDAVISDWREFTTDKTGAKIDGAYRFIDSAAVARDPQLALGSDVWAPPAAVLYRRIIVEKVGGFREDLPVIQDARHLFDAARHGARFSHSRHLGALYRIVDQSLSRRDPGRFWRDVLLNGQQIEVLWSSDGAMSPARRAALAGIYSVAARGLFAAENPAFFRAAREARQHGGASPHTLISGLLARIIGLRLARKALSWIGR